MLILFLAHLSFSLSLLLPFVRCMFASLLTLAQTELCRNWQKGTCAFGGEMALLPFRWAVSCCFMQR